MSDASLFDLGSLTPSNPSPAPADASPSSPQQPRSLYRKYRPRSFAEDDLVGQEHIVNTLRNAIALDRIAHAYLFCGPRGTGKTTTARLLAKAVNCLAPDPRLRPCNVCDACVAINRNATTDVLEIDAASNRGIDDIRDLRERVKYAPSQLRTKFYIIDEAHQITGAAANAFLKTLEEPPVHTRFVLATTDPEELLPTIVSRCQRFDFRRIALDAMVARLRTVADAEGIAVEDDALSVIARHATGSLRDALGILDQVAVYRDRADSVTTVVSVALVRTVLGVSRSDRVESLVTALAERDAATALRSVNDAFEAGEDIRQLGRQLVQYLRALLLTKAGGDTDVDERGRALAGRFDLARLADLTRRLADVDYRAKHATFVQLPLELALVEACLQAEPASPTRDSVASVQPPVAPRPAEARSSLRDRVRGTATPTPTSTAVPMSSNRDVHEPPSPTYTPTGDPRPPAELPPPAAVANGTAVQHVVANDGALVIDVVVDLWTKIRHDVKAVNRRVEALLQQVDPVSIEGETVVLTSPYEFHRNRLNSDEVRRLVEDVISRLVGRRVLVSCVARSELDASVAEATVMSTAASTSGPEPATSEPRRADIDPAARAASVSTAEDDERRLQAAKNIFDAEEIDEDEL